MKPDYDGPHDAERLEIARRNIGRVIENDQLELYPNGQLGMALQIVEKYRYVLENQTMTKPDTTKDERPLAAEADGLVIWLAEDVSPNQAHTVIEYLSDRGLLNGRGEAFSEKFWEDWIQEQDWLPVQERERAAYECPACGASISIAYLRPRSEKIHNRPLCERCEVPMKQIGVPEVEE